MVKSAKYLLLKLTLSFLLLCGSLNKVEAYTYQIGDYGFVNISSNWGILTNWKQWDGIGWNTNPGAVPGTNDNVFILSGNTCIIEASLKNCKNLTVESGATRLYTNLNVPASNRYLNLYGNIVCDGNIGNGATFDNICFNIEGVNDTISGIGAFDCSRMRKNSTTNPTTNLVINMNLTLRFDASSSTQLYNNTINTIFNITIATSSTLTLTGSGNASLDGIDGLGLGERGGFYTINGTMIVPGTFYMSTDNANPIYACGINIGPIGVLKIANPRPVASGLGTFALNMVSGSLLQITGTPFTNSFSPINNIYNLQPGSTIEYSANGPQTVESAINYANLKISGPPNFSTTIMGGVIGSSSTITTSITGNIYDKTIVVGSAAGLAVGMLVSGTGIGAGALITNIAGTTITLSVYNFATVSGTGTFVANTITVGSSAGIVVGMAVTGTGVTAGAAVTAISGTTIYLTFPNAAAPSGPVTFSSDKRASVGATTILGNFTMTGSVFYPNVTIPTVFVGGDWLSTSKVNFFETLSTVVFNGTVNQNIIINPAGNEDFYNLKINKTAGKVFLSSSPATIANILNNLDLTAGNIVTSVTTSTINYYVLLSSAATVSNVSDVSFVEGNCAKLGIVGPINFTFPIGKIAKYRPVTISGTGTSASATMFAEYFVSDPALIPTDLTKKNALDHISRCEYWRLRQQGGAVQNFKITLSWDTYSACPFGVTSLPSLRIASDSLANPTLTGVSGLFTVTASSTSGIGVGMMASGTGIGIGAKVVSIAGSVVTLSVANTGPVSGIGNFYGSWIDQGSFGITGSNPSGTLQTSSTIGFPSSASTAGTSFTLSSLDNFNPLPIELLSFTANAHDQKVILNWVTSSEKNNDYFVVERSNNGYDFESVFKKSGAGTSYIINKYSDVDNEPYSGLSYYRLKQVDYDGSATYSKIIAINLNRKSNILVFPNPADDMLQFSSLENVSFDNSIIEIYNTVGQLLIHDKLNISNGSNYTFPINTLPSGMYRALIFGDNLQAVHLTFVKK